MCIIWNSQNNSGVFLCDKIRNINTILSFNRTEPVFMEKNSKIYIAGHRGLVGSALVRNLEV